MFGMLDYRAHKLYILIFGIPIFILNWTFILGVPFASYAFAKNFASSWWSIFLIGFLAYVVAQIATSILGLIIGKFIEFVFTLIVDIIPADGRTKEEARLVTWGGERVIAVLELGHTPPKDWTEEQFDNVTKGFINWFYKYAIIKRLDLIKAHQQENPEYVSNNYNDEKLLKNNNLAIPISEKIINNKIYREMVIGALLFLCLIIVQPTL